MRVAFVVPGDIEEPTGGYVYDRQVLRALRDRHGVEVFTVPPRPSGVAAAARAALRIRSAGFDAVVQDGMCGSLIGPFNPLFDAPVVGIVHLLAKDDPRKGAVAERVDASYLRTVDSCVYTSVATRRASPSDTESVVARPSSRFSPEVTERTVRREAVRDGLRIVFLGDISPVKGLDRLVRAVSRVPGCRLTAAGRVADRGYADGVGSLCSSLGVGDRVMFAGVLDEGSVGNLLAGSDVVAVPSDHESFGIAYVEGMSFGLPAIAPVSGGARELVEHGRNGFLVSDGNGVAEALRALKENPGLLAEMGTQALRTERDWVTWERTTRKVVGHIERTVGAEGLV